MPVRNSRRRREAPKRPQQPVWLRTLDVVFGALIVLLSLIVLVTPGLAVTLLIFIMAISLVLIGIARIIVGFLGDMSDMRKAINVAVGLITFLVAAGMLLYPGLTVLVMIYILSFNLMLIGISRIIVSGAAREEELWLRTFFMIVGILNVVLSFAIFLMPEVGEIALVVILSIIIMLNGIERILSGVSGL